MPEKIITLNETAIKQELGDMVPSKFSKTKLYSSSMDTSRFTWPLAFVLAPGKSGQEEQVLVIGNHSYSFEQQTQVSDSWS